MTLTGCGSTCRRLHLNEVFSCRLDSALLSVLFWGQLIAFQLLRQQTLSCSSFIIWSFLTRAEQVKWLPLNRRMAGPSPVKQTPLKLTLALTECVYPSSSSNRPIRARDVSISTLYLICASSLIRRHEAVSLRPVLGRVSLVTGFRSTLLHPDVCSQLTMNLDLKLNNIRAVA